MVGNHLKNRLFHIRQGFAPFLLVKDFRNLCMRHVSGDNHRTFQIQAGLDRILGKIRKHVLHRTVQVDFHRRSQIHGIPRRNVIFRMVFHLFEPEPVFVNLRLDVAVRRTAYPDRNRTARRMARAADNADIVHQILAAELRADSGLLANVQNLFFHFEIAENAPAFGTRRRNVVQVTAAGELHRMRVHLGASSANNNRQVVRRASRRAESLHFFRQKFFQGLRVEERFRHRPVIRLVRRAAAFGHKEKFHFRTFLCMNIDLGGQIAGGILFFVHRKRSDLAVAQIFCRVGVVNAFGNRCGVVESGPNLLALVRHANRRSRILAERKNPLGSDHRIFQHGQGDELVVVAGFRILENARDLSRMSGTQAKFDFFKSGLSDFRQSLFGNFQDFLAFKFGNGNALLSKTDVFCGIFTVLNGRFVLKCHKNLYKKNGTARK